MRFTNNNTQYIRFYIMMNQQEILKKIGQIIQELNDQQQYLSKTSKINDLELELFIANADFLIDHIEVLKKLGAQNELVALEVAPAEVQIIEVIATEESLAEEPEDMEELAEIVEVAEQPLFDFSFEEESEEQVFEFEKPMAIEEVFDRVLSEEEKEILLSKTVVAVADEVEKEDLVSPAEEEVGPEPFLITQEEIEETEITLEVVKEEIPIVMEEVEPAIIEVPESKMTLNELLSSKAGNANAVSNFANSGTTDLKTVISLNDKMIFIKDLFNGYNLAYSEAIEILNRFEAFEAADHFLLKNYAQKNNWENKQEVVDRFYEYIHRKFVK
jgi:hypothetical protein